MKKIDPICLNLRLNRLDTILLVLRQTSLRKTLAAEREAGKHHLTDL